MSSVEGVKRRLFYNLMPTYRNSFNELISNSWAIEDEQDQVLRLHPVIRDMIRKEFLPTYSSCIVPIQSIHNYIQTYGTKLSETDKKDICKILKSINEIVNFYDANTPVTSLLMTKILFKYFFILS